MILSTITAFPSLFLLLILLLHPLKTTAQPAPNETSSYTYIVIGSGPGGGPLACNLARAGHPTLLLEAGDDERDDIRTVIANGGYFITPSNSWSFFVRHHPDDEVELRNNHLTWRLPSQNGTGIGPYWVGNAARAPEGAELLGVWYPRGATVGGSSVTNAMATWLPNDSDWDFVQNVTGDASWNHQNIRQIFERIEKNNYLPKGTPGHGFDGYFNTNLGNGSQYLNNPGLMDILKSHLRSIGKDPEKLIEMVGSDGNFLGEERDTTEGMWGLSFHATDKWERYSSRTYIYETLAAKNADGSPKWPLTLSTNSLATKVLFEETEGGKPKAVGVEYLAGNSTYGADVRRNASKKGETRRLMASREVIVAGGAFNSPQLLQLSGIGNKTHLEALGIEVVADLPGVGRNLQDNQEFPVVGHAQLNLTATPNPNEPICAKGSPGDPCEELWRQGKGPYMRPGYNSNALLLRSNFSLTGERDVFVFSWPRAFRGFWPEVQQPELLDPPTTVGFSTVKMHPQNTAGYIKIRSADPTEPPQINFELYKEGAETDLGALAEVVAWGRRSMRGVQGPWGPVEPAEPPCSRVESDGRCGDADPESDKDWIRQQTFGHHPTGTCKMGAADDGMAVVDSEFRVFGVDGLRVVDASVFPRAPGAFPAVATFIISQKASDVLLGGRRMSEP
ncbi:GMC oxidoreductase [Colletotrichum fioriniae PJ7]|uniref:GMC oxidoreductase n=1 Tax=Colletotrichum fioriniae PJ7 TaxID=1445577 RepID=A0A010RGE7_9PEZI|nr:GMC oxidoreductase [Colletotrichum fioriniae PJ7]